MSAEIPEKVIVEIKDLDVKETVDVPISPDQAYHNNGQWSALLKHFDDNGYNIRITVGGEVKRHTFLMDAIHDETTALKAARTTEETWIDKNLLKGKNKEIYEKMLKERRLEILRWGEWKVGKYKDKFSKIYEFINVRYLDINSNFHKAVNAAQTIFCSAFDDKNKNNSNYLPEKARVCSVNYILEECALFAMWQLLGHKQLVYPISTNPTNKRVFNCVSTIASDIAKDTTFFKELGFNPDNFREVSMRLIDISIKGQSKKTSPTSSFSMAPGAVTTQIPIQTQFVVAHQHPTGSPPKKLTNAYNTPGIGLMGANPPRGEMVEAILGALLKYTGANDTDSAANVAAKYTNAMLQNINDAQNGYTTEMSDNAKSYESFTNRQS